MSIRYHRYAVSPTSIPIATAQSCNKLDALAQTSSTATKASEEAWDTDLATTQANFVAKFVGLATCKKRAGDVRVFGHSVDNEIAVYTEGEYVIPVAALGAAKTIGTKFGPAKDTGNALVNNLYVEVSALTSALFVLTENAPSGATEIVCRLIPSLTNVSR